jgi:hypothetical protein
MSMNLGNPAIQNTGILMWDGVSAAPVQINKHIRFGFSFQVVTALTADTTFNAVAAPPSDADICVPGTFVPVLEVPRCEMGVSAAPGPQAGFVLPAGTPAGSICTATLPCKPDTFLGLQAAGGETGQVRAVIILQGPK